MSKLEREKVFIKRLQKHFFLNFISLEDEEWLTNHYPDDTLAAAFTPETANIDVILDVFYRFMDDDAKRMFWAIKLVEFKDGVEIEFSDKNPVARLKKIISGADEIVEIFFAFKGLREKSSPDRVVNEKKRLLEAASSARAKSLTSSSMNTDGLDSKSVPIVGGS